MRSKVKEKFKNQLGMSLIEIMVAFNILILAFVGLAQSFPFGLSISKESERATVSSYLAQEKIEELISLGYNNIDVGIIEVKHRLSDNSQNYLYYYQRKSEVNYVDSDLNNSILDIGIKKILATIYYINPLSGVEKEYNMTTLISER